ncbi:MAG: LPXTG cell wall anchor domain-containing protein, partial [Actinomycetota bacterium]|nr:LPXTG cell wall anchor domain-containing protein [Actinomycetota bacterium]
VSACYGSIAAGGDVGDGTAAAKHTATATATATAAAGGGSASAAAGGELPDTGGASLFALGAGALLVAGGLLARRIVR